MADAQTMHITEQRKGAVHLLVAALALPLLVSCGGSDPIDFPQDGLKITATSPAVVSGKFGDLIPVEFVVTTADGGVPPVGTKVTLSPSDGGTVARAAPYSLEVDGRVGARWRLAPVAKVQALTVIPDGGRPFNFQANVTGNPWTVNFSGTLRYVARLADERSISPDGPAWATTHFGSPPRLIIWCNAGVVGVAITHSRMLAEGTAVEYSFDGPTTNFDNWAQLAPRSDSLFHPGPAAAAGTLAKQIAASSQFRLTYNQFFPTGGYVGRVSPTFGTSGLSLVMPQLMASCPAGR